MQDAEVKKKFAIWESRRSTALRSSSSTFMKSETGEVRKLIKEAGDQGGVKPGARGSAEIVSLAGFSEFLTDHR